MSDLPDWYQSPLAPADKPQAVAALPDTVKSDLPDWYSADDSAPARESVRLSQNIPPQKAAQVLKLSAQSGLPTDFVSRNADALQKQADNAAITPQFSQDHPVVSSWLGEDPHNAALAGPDIPVLGSVERQFSYLANQTERGAYDVERQVRGMFKGFGLSDNDNELRIQQIDKRLETDLNKPAPGPISSVFGHAAEAAPALAGAVGVGAVAAMASVPATAATATAFGAMEFGNAYLDYSKRKDALGNPKMTDNEARGFAMLSGIGNGLLFTLPVGKWAEQIPGLRMISKEGLSSLIESPTAFGAMKAFASRVGETGLTMGGFSGFSSLIHSASGHLAEMKADGSLETASPMAILSRILPSEDLKAATKSAASGVVTGGILGGAIGGIDAYSNYRKYAGDIQAKDLYYAQQVRNAHQTAESWNGIGQALASTKMAEMAPEQVDKLVSRMAPDQHVFIPLEPWQTYWEGQKADPRAVFHEIMGNTTAYDEALRTGVDLPIPAGKYAATIARSDHAEFFNQHLRADPQAMNLDDAAKSIGLQADMEDEAQQADKQKSEQTIKDDIIPLPAAQAKPPEAQAVDASHETQGIAPLFPQPTAVGMTAEKAARYREAIESARAKAQEDIVRSITDKQIQQKSSSWLAERAKVQADVEQDVSRDPGQNALASLRNHQTPDGLEMFRLSRSDIEKDYPELHYSLDKLPEGVSVKEGGIHPDDAAARLGYNSGSELLHDLLTIPDKNELVQRLTDERMLERHPEARSFFGTAPDVMDEAMKAVHNEKRSQVLRLELEHLASDDFAAFKGLAKAMGRRIPRIEEVQDEARSAIGAKTTAETLPGLYQRAESVASREAQEHFLRGDFEKAFEAKQAELRNHELYRAALDAKDQAARDQAFAAKFDNDSTRARIGKAGADYLEQIDAIRDRFDFSRTTQKALGSRQSLRDWVQAQVEAGYNPTVPPDLLEQASKRSWREMTNDELHQTVDSMRNIAHLAGLKNKLLASLKERTFDETRQGIVDALVARYAITPRMLAEPYDLHPDFLTKIKGDLNSYGAWHTRMEPLFEQFGIHDAVFQPLNDAEDFKTSQMREAVGNLKDIFSVYSKAERAKFGRLTYIPELEGSGLSPNLNKMEMLMTLLHGGNEGNMAEVMRGYRMTEPQLRAIWSHLEPRDIELAQKIWGFVDSYWPAISKQERELNGLAPEKIQGRPLDVTLKDGSVHHVEGGYFPLVYDKNVSWRTAALGQDAMVKDMFPSYASNTATRHNWTQARVGGGGQAPSLKFNVLTNHVFDVIHDLAYRKPVIDLYKLLNDDDVRANMEAGAGKGVYAQMNPWLKRIAGDRQWEPMGPFEAIRAVRSNMTVAELGFKMTSALVHTTSLFPATRELGASYMAQGFKAFSDLPTATEFMWDKSEFMRSRWEDVGDRDIRSAAGGLNLVNAQQGFWSEMKAMSPVEQKDAWIVMRCADMAVAGPTWHGAYLKAMDGKVRGIEGGDEPGAVAYADQLVRDTKGSGAAKDLAPYQTVGGSFGKLMTMFQTQLNVIANQLGGAYRDYRVDKNIGKLTGAAVASWFAPAVASELLRGRTPRSDEHWASWAGKAIAKFPFELMPLTNPIVRYMERPGDKVSLLPVEEALSTIAKTALNATTKNPIADKITGDESEWTTKDYQDAMMTLGYLKGLPTRQVTQSAMRLHGWMSGEEPHDNPVGGMWSVATGTKPNE